MTQTQIIMDAVTWVEKSIKDIASETHILEPNIRRILGHWTKIWIFERIAPGIYTITVGDKTKCIIKCWDALQEIKKLAKAPYKFDMVFLDIPYKTAAVIWWNRWAKYSMLSPEDFKKFLTDLKQVIHKDTHIYHMYSNAPSWLKQMNVYNDLFEELGFKLQAIGWWQKLYKSGKPVAFCWKVSEREWLNLYSLSEINTSSMIFDFETERPKTHSEKCLTMLTQLILQSTKIGDRILDSFAWTGSTARAAIPLERNVMLIEKSEDRVRDEILPGIFTLFPTK